MCVIMIKSLLFKEKNFPNNQRGLSLYKDFKKFTIGDFTLYSARSGYCKMHFLWFASYGCDFLAKVYPKLDT